MWGDPVYKSGVQVGAKSLNFKFSFGAGVICHIHSSRACVCANTH